MKIWKSKKTDIKSTKPPGTIEKTNKDGLFVATKDNLICIEEIQMPNKKRMLISEYIKGNELKEDTILK